MAEPQVKSPQNSQGRLKRFGLAACAFAAVLIGGALVSFILGLLAQSGLETILPEQSGDGTGWIFPFLWWVFILAVFLAALVGALFVWDASIGPWTEGIGLVIALIVTGSAWAVNFAEFDELISVRAQVAFEFVGATAGIGALILVFRWSSSRPTLVGIKIILIFMITLLFIITPVYLGVNYFLEKFFRVGNGLRGGPLAWAAALGSILSLAVSMGGVATARTPSKEPSVEDA